MQFNSASYLAPSSTTCLVSVFGFNLHPLLVLLFHHFLCLLFLILRRHIFLLPKSPEFSEVIPNPNGQLTISFKESLRSTNQLRLIFLSFIRSMLNHLGIYFKIGTINKSKWESRRSTFKGYSWINASWSISKGN